MAATWSEEETLKLVEIWGDAEIQVLLEGAIRNKHVYDRIAEGMKEAGYVRTGVQCRDKIKKMKTEYKKIKDNNNQTGRDRKVWKFYDCMNDILGNKPATRPAIVVDTLEEAQDVELEAGEKNKEKGMAVEDHDETTNEKTDEKTDEKVDDREGQVEEIKIEREDVKREKQRKNKRTKEDKFEKAMDVIIDKVVTAQKENEEMFLRLEEKRMKLDERLLEMEDRRLKAEKEREERTRRKEREFQCRMMMMMNQGYVGSPRQFSQNFNYSHQSSSSSSSQP